MSQNTVSAFYFIFFWLPFHLQGKVRTFSYSLAGTEFEYVQDLYPKLTIAQDNSRTIKKSSKIFDGTINL